jgi:hypothetical protein
MTGHLRPRSGYLAITLLFAIVTLAALGACGGSSQPAYCGDRTNLQNSVKGLPGAITSGGLSSLKSQLTTIQSQATSLVNSAKKDFPSETSAITSAMNALKGSVQALPSSPSVTELASVATDASTLLTSVNNFVNATKSKCS